MSKLSLKTCFSQLISVAFIVLELLVFNAQKFRGHMTLATPLFLKIFKDSCPDCPWQHACLKSVAFTVLNWPIDRTAAHTHTPLTHTHTHTHTYASNEHYLRHSLRSLGEDNKILSMNAKLPITVPGQVYSLHHCTSRADPLHC